MRADVGDVNRRFKELEGAMGGVDGASKRLSGTMGGAALQTGRLGNQFAGLAGQLTGIHPIIGNVAGVLGNFAVGSALTVGVLGGLAAIALAYDVLTKSAREATKAQDESVKSLLRARHLKIVGGGTGEDVINARSKLNALLAEGGRLQRELDANRGIPILEGLTLEKIQANEDAIHAVQQAIISGNETIASSANNATGSVVKLKDTYMDLREAAAKVNAEATKANRDWWVGYIEKTGEALTLTEELNRAIMADRPSLVEVYRSLMTQGTPSGTFDMPKIAMPFEGLDDKQKKNLIELGIIKDDANTNAKDIQTAIWGAAIQSASLIAGALNVGGGGKGSQLGGAIGSTAGFVLGTPGGPIGQAIGSLVGNIAGSFIGGLFDHKKAIEINTNAVRANTAALMLNSPSGYKTASGRFSATDVKELKRVIPSYNSRGGAVASI